MNLVRTLSLSASLAMEEHSLKDCDVELNNLLQPEQDNCDDETCHHLPYSRKTQAYQYCYSILLAIVIIESFVANAWFIYIAFPS